MIDLQYSKNDISSLNELTHLLDLANECLLARTWVVIPVVVSDGVQMHTVFVVSGVIGFTWPPI